MPDIDIDAPGTSQLFMGNEAIARGALEAGIGFAAAYPGTPSSEILGSLSVVAKRMGIYAEWSVNEMVATEAAAGASLAGIRAITAMKQLGVNVASDFLSILVMSGLGKGGLVLVSCDDPGAISSDNEEDARNLAKSLGMPLLEPGNFQEAKDMTKWLFDLSEEIDSICMLRSVTRIAHSRGLVKLGELPKKEHKAFFDQYHDLKDVKPTKFMPHPVPMHHAALLKKLEKAQKKFETSPFNWYVGPDKPDLLIITAGSCWLYSRDVVKELKLEDKIGILKLGTLWPLPEEFIKKHLNKAQKVLFVEEVDPFIERSVMELAASLPPDSPRPIFYGKRSGHLNAYGEMDQDVLIKVIADMMGVTYQPRDTEYAKKAEELAALYVPERSIGYCPGCSHRAAFWAVKNALKLDGRNGFVTGDIGCYGMALRPTGFMQSRSHYCMGSGTGVANGLGQLGRYGLNQPVLTICGDSTFFHATIPALINGVHQKSNFILIILDNSGTAMTGFQPHPGTELNAMGEPVKLIKMEDLCRSLGVQVEICDPFDLKKTTDTLLNMMADDGDGGAKVMIMRRQCELMRARNEKTPPYKVHVNLDECIGESCGCDKLCTRVFHCPGLIWDEKSGKAKIDEVICAGCGVCADICPQGAIAKEAL